MGGISENNKYTMKRGSSRFLISNQQNFDTVLQTCWMEVIENKDFAKIKQLVPEGCVCGFGDEILGVHGY